MRIWEWLYNGKHVRKRNKYKRRYSIIKQIILLSFSVKSFKLKVITSSSTWGGNELHQIMKLGQVIESRSINLPRFKNYDRLGQTMRFFKHLLMMISTARLAIIRSSALEHNFSQNAPPSLLLVSFIISRMSCVNIKTNNITIFMK